MKKINIENVEKIIKEVKQDAEFLEQRAKELNLYISIDLIREKEKRLNKNYPFLYLSGINMVNYNSNKLNKLVDELKRQYKDRYNRLLRELGFISLNLKTGTIKARGSYGNIPIYYLGYLEEFEDLNLNDKDIEILTKYKNGNIEFKFKDVEIFNKFKDVVVFHINEETEYILKNITAEEKQKFLNADKLNINKYCLCRDIIERGNFENSGYLINFNLYLIEEKLKGVY